MTSPASVRRSRFLRSRPIAAGLGFGIALAFGAGVAQADMLCGEREQIVGELKKTWQEDRTAIGLSNNGGVLEVFSSNEGTWTLLMTTPDGKTCMIGAGEHWETQIALLGEPV